MRSTYRLAAVITVLVATLALATTAQYAVAAAPGKPVASKSGLQPGYDLAFRIVNEDGSKTDDASVSDCGLTGTCVLCDVFPWAPNRAGTIIVYQGGVYCYMPDQGYRPAPVVEIRMDLGIYNHYPRLSLVRSQPYRAAWTDHLDIVDAIPCGNGEYSTIMSVVVEFPECCPIVAVGGFQSFIRPITC